MTENRLKNSFIGFIIFVYLFGSLTWNYIDSYYICQSIVIFCLCFLVFLNSKNIFTFLLLSLSLNSILDELLFNPHKLQINEFFIPIFAILIWKIFKKYTTKL